MLFIEPLQVEPAVLLAVVITVVLSITIHELAHGDHRVWLGDRTPIERGHMTLNPVVHMGMFSIDRPAAGGHRVGPDAVDRDRLRGRHGDAIVAARRAGVERAAGTARPDIARIVVSVRRALPNAARRPAICNTCCRSSAM